MADGTLSIHVPQTGATPEDYLVSGAAAINVLAVRGSWDGSGAAGDFLPVVQFLNAAEEVMAQAQGATVTAGDSVDYTFAPFLRSQASTPSGGITAQTARYGVNGLSVNANATGFYELTGPSFGPSLLDLTTPDTPTVLVDGIYAFAFVARVDIATGGTPTAGSGWSIGITNAGGGQSLSQLMAFPSVAGTYVRTQMITSVPAFKSAGDTVQFSVTNRDAAGNRHFDSPGISVTLLS